MVHNKDEMEEIVNITHHQKGSLVGEVWTRDQYRVKLVPNFMTVQ